MVVVGVFFVFGDPFSMLEAPQNSAGDLSLIVQDEVMGTGAEAAAGDTLSVHYTGKLEDGTVFDTSLGEAPHVFVLGTGEVIAGWDQGLVGMKQGGKRLLIIPASLGYGAVDYGPIPANSTLIFEVELVKVVKGQ